MTNQIRVVTLENLEPRLVCYNLNHEHTVARVFPRVHVLPNGQQHGEFVTRALPDSITFLAKEIKTFPASVLGCEEIEHALNPKNGQKPRLRQRGDVISQDVAEPAEAAAAASPDAPAEIVNTTAKKARDAARLVTGSQATVEEKKD